MSESRRSDVDILRDVREELAWDARVEGAPVSATLFDGAVTLKGTAGSWTTRLAAEEAARRIRGVREVVNHIVVNPKLAHARRDADIAQAVRHALEWDAKVPDKRICATVADGAATLEGAPSTHELRANIEHALARHVAHAAAHVEIHVEPGKVTLRGHVPSCAERQVVEGAVRGTPGVSNVESHLAIR
jgi:osmotically-inducible protein OsmY